MIMAVIRDATTKLRTFVYSSAADFQKEEDKMVEVGCSIVSVLSFFDPNKKAAIKSRLLPVLSLHNKWNIQYDYVAAGCEEYTASDLESVCFSFKGQLPVPLTLNAHSSTQLWTFDIVLSYYKMGSEKKQVFFLYPSDDIFSESY